MKDIKLIRTNQTNKEYQYSSYKVGWVFEVINDFGEYYTAMSLEEKYLTEDIFNDYKLYDNE